MSGYFVVEFFEEEGRTVEVVPAKWIFQQNKKCNWPCGLDRLKFTNLVIKCADPLDQPKIKWSIYDCNVLFGTDNYQRAVKVANTALEQSDLETTDSEAIRGQERRVLRNQVRQRVDLSHEIQESDSSPAVEKPLENIFHTKATEIIFEGSEAADTIIEVCYPPSGNEDGNHGHGTTIFSMTVPSSAQGLGEESGVNLSSSDNSALILEELRGFQKIVLKKLLKLAREVDHISRVVGRLGVSSIESTGLNLPDDITLPLKNGTELAVIHRWLEKSPNQQKMIGFLRGIGGSDMKDCIKRMFERLLTTPLCRSVNLSGANGKIAFRKHHLRSSIISALRSDSQPDKPTEKDIDECFTRYFGGSGDRDGGRAARRKPNVTPSTEEPSQTRAA